MKRVELLEGKRSILSQCAVADGYFSRLKGLIGRKALGDEEGIFFPRCNSIHMWFMSIPIDVVFLKASGHGIYRVSSLRARVRPWKILPLNDFKASDVLELPAGAIGAKGIKEGDLLCIS